MDQPTRVRSNSSAMRTIASESDRVRTFGQARRHSVFVRLLKFALPMVVVVMLGGYAALFLIRSKVPPGLDIGKVSIDPTNLTMEKPVYNGFGTDGSHYVIRAKNAVQDLRQQGPIKLNEIDGDITQPTGVITHLKADWGTYDQKTEILELYDKIDIDGSTGMKARLTRATVFSKESRIVSTEPVYAETETGNIRSRKMVLNSKSKQSTFTEDVHVRMKSNQPAPPANGAPPAAPKTAAMPGLAANSGQPIEVKSERLDIDDNAKTALFKQNVIAKQGDAILEAPELDVLYEGNASAGGAQKKPATAADATPAASGAEPQSKLKLIKARGGVAMTNKDDHATAETLDYDAATERATLKGNVVMTSINDRRVTAAQVDLDQKADTVLMNGDVVVIQGKNTMKGRRLFVDRKQGRTRLESPADGKHAAGRIQTVFYQNAAKEADAKGKAKALPVQDGAENAGGLISFKTDPSQPIEIDAETMDVFDANKTAIYKGFVVAKQGDFMIKTIQMTAFYTGQAAIASAGSTAQPQAKGAKGGAKAEDAQSTQLQRVEARQKVVVTGRDNEQAVGDEADFDVKSNTVVMRGKVIVSKGSGAKQSVVQGPEGSRLFIDMTTGISRFETTTSVEASAGKNGFQPVVSASQAAAGPGSTPSTMSECPPGAICKTGRMRAVFYPKEATETAKKAGEKAGVLPPTDATKGATKPATKDPTASSAWEASTKTSTGKQ